MQDKEIKKLMDRLSCTLFNGSQSASVFTKDDILTAIRNVLVDYNKMVPKDLEVTVLDFRNKQI